MQLYPRAYNGRDKEEMINSMREVVESLKDFVQVSRKRKEENAQEVVREVLNEMKNIVVSDDTLYYRAINWLVENLNKITVLKALSL
ncbi:hypothetical protein RYX36_030917, partial [Vicia faba]